MAAAALAVALCLAAYGYAFARPADDARIQATGWSAQPALSRRVRELSRRPTGGRRRSHPVPAHARSTWRRAGRSTAREPAGRSIHPDRSRSTKDGDVARRWYAGVSNLPRPERAASRCSRSAPRRLTPPSRRPPSRSRVDRTGHATARCPAGRRALGGGLVQSGWPDDRILASGPRDASGASATPGTATWPESGTRSFTTSPPTAVGFKVFALCSADSHATIEATRFECGGRADRRRLGQVPGIEARPRRRSGPGGPTQVPAREGERPARRLRQHRGDA